MIIEGRSGRKRTYLSILPSESVRSNLALPPVRSCPMDTKAPDVMQYLLLIFIGLLL